MAYSSDLYQQVILDHNKNPRNFRIIENPTHHCQGHNPLCGDDITVYMILNADGVISDLSFQGHGCAISKASASMMTNFLKGKPLNEVRIIFREFHEMVKGEWDPTGQDHHLGKLIVFEGVRQYPSRIKCASLAWHALIGAADRNASTSTERSESTEAT